MTDDEPFTTIIVPARNEQAYIRGCLESILAGTFPLNRLEILVVDGNSSDGTRDIVLALAKEYSMVRLLDNPDRAVSQAMNIGIRASTGEYIVRVDAHATYGRDYVTQLVGWIRRLDADNVGGTIVTVPASESAEARAVAIAMSHPFGVGNSRFRIGSLNAPQEVDTVPFGCFRRNVFDRIGLYDEMFVRNQDDELNARLKNAGGRIVLVPGVEIEYVARNSIRKLALMMYQYGYFKPAVARKLGRPATLRQLAPPAFVATVLAMPLLVLAAPSHTAIWASPLLAHCLINAVVCLRRARHDRFDVLLYLFSALLAAHVAYGLGYLRGALDFWILEGGPDPKPPPVHLTR